MRKFCSALALCAALALQPAMAQSTQQQSMEASVERLEASMAAAQAQAARPGDESLDCDQIETEMATTMQDPAVQNYVREAGIMGEERMREYQEGARRARAQMMGSLVTGFVSSMIGSFVPGAGYAQMLAQRAQMAQQQRQAEENMARVASMLEQVEPAMPHMMRGQRLYELAQARQCDFLQQAAPAQ